MTAAGNLRYGVGMVRARGTRRLPLVFVATLAIASVFPGSALGRTGSPEPGARAAAAPTTVFTLDLSAPGDFVAQANFVQCVGASMQMMLNMIRPRDDRSAETQRRLQELARSLSGERPDGRTRKGASVIGWTAGLNVHVGGSYRTAGAEDLQDTLRMAARAMRVTNRPVGLLMWRGRHAWVMAGFSATADPLLTQDFEVTRVIVLDPLYPYGSKTWGASPKPRQALTVAQLGRQFVPRGTRPSIPEAGAGAVASPGPSGSPDAGSGWRQALAGKFVIVMPVTTPASARAARLLH